jgi:predicted DNA-binding protein
MGRPAMNLRATVVRLPQGMDERIDAVLEDGERRADLIREAVDREIKRRERKAVS